MSLASRINGALDREAALTLLKGAVRRESVTGNEANFVSFLNEQMSARNLAPVVEDFLPGRPNIHGQRAGSGDGRRLLFIGHTDTVRAGDWAERWKGTGREDPFGAVSDGGAIWGRGVTDLKGGIAASLAALDTLDRAGIRLKGDLAFAFVGDEESGEEGTGVSAGVAHWSAGVLSGRAPRPDFAIYVEPTGLDVYAAQIGFFIADVTVHGTSAYFGYPEQGVDALRAGYDLLTAIWELDRRLRAQPAHDLTGPTGLLVTQFTAGETISVPGSCRFSVIASLCPGDDLGALARAFEETVRGVRLADGITIDIAFPAGRDHALGGSPAEIDRSLPEIAALSGALNDAAPGAGAVSGAPYWSESPFLVERLGCPTVYCGPGDIACAHTSEERLDIEEYLSAVRGFAKFAAEYCGWEDE